MLRISFNDRIVSIMKKIIITLDSVDSALHKTTLLIVIGIGILLRAFAFQGYADSDPQAYSALANDLSMGIFRIAQYGGPPVFPLRIGIYAPTAFFIKAWGLSEITLVAYPFLVSIAGLILAYGFGMIAFGPLAGLLTAAILAVIPLDIKMASLLYPDAVAAFWANLGIFLVWLSLLSLSQGLRPVLMALAGGFAFGISWLCKESVFYIAPLILILFAFLFDSITPKRKLVLLLFLSLGALSVLLAETWLLYTKTKDVLWHFHATERNYKQCAVWFFDASSPYFGWQPEHRTAAIAKRVLLTGPRFIFTQFLSIPSIALLALAWALMLKKRTFIVPGIWLITLIFMYNFMTSSFQSYMPLPLIDRYLYPILLPSIVIFSGFIATLFKPESYPNVTKEHAFWALFFSGCFCYLLVSHGSYGFSSKPEHAARIVAIKIKKNDIVYTDYRTASSLTFFRTRTLSPSNAFTIPYENISVKEIKPGSYVLIDKKKIEFLRKSYNYNSPSWIDTKHIGWTKVWSDMDAVLYRIMNDSKNATTE
jgi:hypothetical protein